MRIRSLLAVGVCLAVGGCGGGGGGGSGGGGASAGQTLRISITDAPFPFHYVESATVTIDEVRVHERNGDAWTTVFTGSETVDLVKLQNGVTQLLTEATVPPGTYDQVRLIVEAGHVVLTDDAVVEGGDHVFDTTNGRLFFPSGAQTGIKVGIENDIVVTTTLSGDLLLDFDLSKNFVFNGPVTHAPGVKRVLFTPSIRATNASTTGSLRLRAMSDELTPGVTADDMPLVGATVSVFDAGADETTATPVATSSTGADGVAVISVPPGTYDVRVEAAGHTPRVVTGVVVTLANLTDLGDVILAATATITGTVMSDAATPATTADDVSVAGATVDVLLAGSATVVETATTDANGAFQAGGLAAGMYDLVVHATGFADGSLAGVTATLSGADVVILLAASPATLSGTLTDGTSPIAGASVSVANSAGFVVSTTTTSPTGTWSAAVSTGSFAVTFTNGAETKTESVDVVGPGTTTLDATLP